MIDQMKMILTGVVINQDEVALNQGMHVIEMDPVILKVDRAQLQATAHHQDHQLIEYQGQVMEIETRADIDRVQVEEVVTIVGQVQVMILDQITINVEINQVQDRALMTGMALEVTDLDQVQMMVIALLQDRQIVDQLVPTEIALQAHLAPVQVIEIEFSKQHIGQVLVMTEVLEVVIEDRVLNRLIDQTKIMIMTVVAINLVVVALNQEIHVTEMVRETTG